MMNTDPSDSASVSDWWNATSHGTPLVQFSLYDHLLDGRGAWAPKQPGRLRRQPVSYLRVVPTMTAPNGANHAGEGGI
jgi:hypothetical protein